MVNDRTPEVESILKEVKLGILNVHVRCHKLGPCLHDLPSQAPLRP